MTPDSAPNDFYRHTLFRRGKSAKSPYAVGSAGRCESGESRLPTYTLSPALKSVASIYRFHIDFCTFYSLILAHLVVAFATTIPVAFALKFTRYTPLETDVKTRVFRGENSLQASRKSSGACLYRRAF